MQLAGAGVVVSGGGSGLGLASAQAFREAGARVGVVDLTPGDWDGPFARADVRDPGEVAAAFDDLMRETGPVRGSLNCAGSGGSGLCAGPGATLGVDTFRRVMEVHTLGAFVIAKTAAERMFGNAPDAAGERGVLVNVSSIVAMEGQVGTSAYAAAKGGVNAMTLPLAREFAPMGVRVVTVAPGIFETPMFTKAKGPMVSWLREQVQFPHRPGQPAEFATMVRSIFENPMLNGEVIRLDGAFRVPPGRRDWWLE